MPRTPAQNYRRRTNTFRFHCAQYAEGKRKRPPRVKYGITISNWSQIAKNLGVDPKEVYDDYQFYHECVKEAARLRISLEDALSIRWEKHCVEIERVAKARKQEREGVVREIDDGEELENPEARMLANVLLTKVRSKEA